MVADSELLTANRRGWHLQRLVRELREEGDDDAAVLAQVRIDNEKYCRPPLNEPAILALISHASSRQISVAPESIKRLLRTQLSEVSMKPTAWLWPNRIPLGALAIICGEPEAGKTTVTIDLMSRSTAGNSWPNGEGKARAGRWLYLTTENDTQRTIKPRVVAAGGDVHLIEVVKGTEVRGRTVVERGFDLSQDLAELDDIIDYAATTDHPTVGLVLDPLNEYLGEKVDSWRDSDVRRVLGPLVALAEKHQIAVIGIMHPAKAEATTMMNKILGSKAFSGTARVIHFCVLDNEQKGDGAEQSIFVPVKNNLGRKAQGILYRFGEVNVAAGPGDDYNEVRQIGMMPFVDWLGPTDKTALDVLKPRETGIAAEHLAAVTWLNKRLGDEKVPTKVIEQEAEQEGIKRSALKFARKELDVRSEKAGYSTAGWLLYLPPRTKGEGSVF